MICYAVIDTNVIVSALLSKHSDSATVQLFSRVIVGDIIPVYSNDIMNEYKNVLNRKKFNFAPELIQYILLAIEKYGILIEPQPSGEILPDMKDLPFYDIVLEKHTDGIYLVTGNLKHFPQKSFIVTARQMLDILEQVQIR